MCVFFFHYSFELSFFMRATAATHCSSVENGRRLFFVVSSGAATVAVVFVDDIYYGLCSVAWCTNFNIARFMFYCH